MAITHETLRMVAEVRRQVEQLAAGPTRGLTEAWVRAWDTLAVEFAAALNELIQVGGDRWPTRRQIRDAARAKQALDAAGRALERLAAQAQRDITAAASAAARLGADAQHGLAESQLPPGSRIQFQRVDEQQIASLVDRTSEQIHKLTWPLSQAAEAAMKAELVRGIARGDNPADVARSIMRGLEGSFNGGLARAINIARTEILDAHRDAAMLSQLANSDVLAGWMWHAELSSRTCFPAGTPVVTRRGEVAIETVRVDDEVLTHTGRWQRVEETLDRPYAGPMVTVQAGDLSVVATADHPFLVERQGRLNWMAAKDVQSGDTVFSDRQNTKHQRDHRLCEVAVEGCCDQSHDDVAARFEMRASLARGFHRHIVSNVRMQWQRTRVYNFEVECDHSYIASGFVVHNCPSCWSKHGTIHPLDEPGPNDHQSGRCSRTPVTKSWRELGFTSLEPPSVIPDAQTVFRQLPAADQLAIMGPSRLGLLNSGDIAWGDLSQLRTTAGWRDSWTVRPVKDLQTA